MGMPPAQEQPFIGPEQTTMAIGGHLMVLTRGDAAEMREALLAYLQAAPPFEGRDDLLRRTQAVPGWIDPDGRIRIGGWLLDTRGGRLVLAYREPSNAPRLRVFVAPLIRTEHGWAVTELQEGSLRRR